MIQKRRVQLLRQNVPKKAKIGFWFYRLLLIIFFGTSGYIFFFSGLLSVKNLEIRGLEDIGREDVENLIMREINGKYLNIISRDNIVLIRKKVLEQLISDNFRSIDWIESAKKFPDTIIITISERKTGLILSTGERKFLVDREGFVYDDNVSEVLNAKLVTLEDLSNNPANLGEEVISGAYVNYVLDVKSKLKNSLDIDIDNRFETPNRVSSDVRVNTYEGWKILFNAEISLEKEIKMLTAVLKEKIEPSRRTDLEYIDLRIDNKVFYKFKEGSEQEEETKVEGASDEKVEVKKEEKKKKKK